MTSRRVIPVVLAALTIGGCLSLQPAEPPSAYGAFLAARYAGVSRDAQGAADYYAEALQRAPGDMMLTDRAFITALIAGELDRGGALAELAYRAGDQSRLAGLYHAVDLVSRRRYDEAIEIVDSFQGRGNFNLYLGRIWRQWALIGAGEHQAAIDDLDQMSVPGDLATFLMFQRALLLDAAGEHQQAEAAYRTSVFGFPFRRMATEAFGEFLERTDKRADAIALYEAYLSQVPDEASIQAALDRASSGGRPPRRMTPAQFAARAGLGPAMRLAANADMDLTVLYLRMLQRLDPDYAPIRNQIGETLQRIGLPDAALAEYASITGGPFYVGAKVDELWLLARIERMDEAMTGARALVAETNAVDARLLLADFLRVGNGCAEAVGLYQSVIEQHEAEGRAPDWRYHYFRAACLEVTDRWDEAEQGFLNALEIAPDQADVLNYLGYVWVDRGENLEQAMEMIERAAALEPEAGHIIDSLGWAHYRLGNYETAVLELERATALNPGSATANFHLGDAYWRVGRHLEAGFQWRRALDLDAEPEEIAALRDRLENGMPAEGADAWVEAADTP